MTSSDRQLLCMLQNLVVFEVVLIFVNNKILIFIYVTKIYRYIYVTDFVTHRLVSLKLCHY